MKLPRRNRGFYSMVPKDPAENLRFRRAMIERGCQSDEAARQIWMMCRREPLFWVNTFAYTYDPRKQPSTLPFITYEYQDDVLNRVIAACGDHDVLIEKSRDMGASWLCLTAFTFLWQFFGGKTFLLVSRKEELVDKPADPKSLFWKIDMLLKRQPKWLLPNYTRRYMSCQNDDNGSTMDGESTTGDVGRGDRRTAILLDEFAAVANGYEVLFSTRDAADCRIFNSTPKGSANAFYDMSLKEIEKIRLHWTLHPEKALGVYEDDNGCQRSPWYDTQCKRTANPTEVAQELDINYQGSDYQFFDTSILDEILKRDVRVPSRIGRVEYEDDTAALPFFTDDENGDVRLWTPVTAKGYPPTECDYAMGVDISAGSAPGTQNRFASNSTISVANMSTGVKVAEVAVAGMQPDRFAILAVALARWFRGKSGHGAYMIWEANGTGIVFSNAIDRLGYRNFFYRRNEKKVNKRVSDIPGWWTTTDSKLALLGEYRRALAAGEYTNRSKIAIEECRYYVHLGNGKVSHSRSARSVDPTGAGMNHGDRVIADALCNWAMKDTRLTPRRETVDEKPIGSFAYRQYRRMRNRARSSLW